MFWIDVNDCPERFHEIEELEEKSICVHADGSECQESEYGIRSEA